MRTDTERLDAMIEHGWSISGPYSAVPESFYIVFRGECDDLARHEDPRMAIDLAIDALEKI